MPTKTDEEIGREAIEAVGRGDLETLKGLLADDVIWEIRRLDEGRDGSLYEGRDAVVEAFGSAGKIPIEVDTIEEEAEVAGFVAGFPQVGSLQGNNVMAKTTGGSFSGKNANKSTSSVVTVDHGQVVGIGSLVGKQSFTGGV